jgi:hypothetical protein
MTKYEKKEKGSVDLVDYLGGELIDGHIHPSVHWCSSVKIKRREATASFSAHLGHLIKWLIRSVIEKDTRRWP